MALNRRQVAIREKMITTHLWELARAKGHSSWSKQEIDDVAAAVGISASRVRAIEYEAYLRANPGHLSRCLGLVQEESGEPVGVAA